MTESTRRWRTVTPAAVLVLAGVAALAFALGTTSRGTALAADPTAAPSQSTAAGPFGPKGAMGAWMDGGWKSPLGGMHRMMRDGVQITITAIDGTKLSLKTSDGWTRTIDASGVTITRSGQTINVGDLKAGDTIEFRQTRESDGSFKVTSIEVVLPTAAGTVSSVSASSVTITQPDGTNKTIGINDSTTYSQAGANASKSALVAGVRILAEGTTSGDSFTATRIEIMPSLVAGTVSSKTADAIVVKTADGKSVTVKTTSRTRFAVPGKTNATIADVAAGDRIVAHGTLNSDGSLTATMVGAGSGEMPGFGLGDRDGRGFGRGHMGGMGGMGGFGGFGPGLPGLPSAAPSTGSGSNG